MVSLDDVSGSLLQPPSNSDAAHAAHAAPPSRAASHYRPLRTFDLDKQRTYQQQYGDMYFLRLTRIRPAVEQVASAAWDGTVVAGEAACQVERVLDVRQGELCWVAGTVYMDMPLKPDILEDVSKDRWISAPLSTPKYFDDDNPGTVALEDDSGRIKLVGNVLQSLPLVTGAIIAVLGTENAGGELEVIDFCLPDLAPQPERWSLAPSAAPTDRPIKSSKLAIVSGLSFSGTDASHALELDLLLEFLLGEALSPSTAQGCVSAISRLVIAGNSIVAADAKSAAADAADKKASKKYGYDAAAYNPLPSQLLDDFLHQLLPSLPVTLLPGERDPANASYPQQPIHTAMLPKSRVFGPDPTEAEAGWLDAVTNPWEAEVDGWRVLGTGGQNVDDVFKYVDSNDRLGMMEATCRWRCVAPTAPDTLWSYPFQDDDPLVMKASPHLYFAGNQPEFSTKVIHGQDGQSVRLLTVPSFAETQEVVLVDMETLDISRVKIAIC